MREEVFGEKLLISKAVQTKQLCFHSLIVLLEDPLSSTWFVHYYIEHNECVSSVVHQAFTPSIGNGHSAQFWTDNMTGMGDLTSCFLRIFILARIK